MTPSTNPPTVGKFADQQLPNRLSWGIIPDDEMSLAAMHVVHIYPLNGSTITTVNPTDPATDQDVRTGWLERPSAYGPIVKAGR